MAFADHRPSQRPSPEEATRGLIIGRFLPPHKGHQFLIDLAWRATDHLDVMVCTLSSEPIPGEVRLRWLQESFPAVSFIHVTEEIPAAARDQAGATQIWADTVRRRLGEPPTHVFASETYGDALAAQLGAAFVAVDPPRTTVPVSAAEIRNDPFGMWEYILPVVRPYLTFRVLMIGSSSAVRDRCAAELAVELDTMAVPDYRARIAVRSTERDPSQHDAMRIQAAAQVAVEQRCSGIVILATQCADPELAPDFTVDAGMSVREAAERIRAVARPRHFRRS